MRAVVKAAVVVAAMSFATGTAAGAGEPRTADAAIQAAKRHAACPACEFDFSSRAAQDSARRGLVSVGVGAPEGGGYVLIMAYTGTSWGVLWEGNGNTRNVETLPGRIAICMDRGGWTNVRSGPGLSYRRVGKVSSPTIKKAFEVRLIRPVGRHEGEAWYRISYNGRPAWVQNFRTLQAWRTSAGEACAEWRDYWSRSQ